ncbi:1,2-oxophytodienoate reductase [Rhodococcus sp. SC4]|nr:1,2-oxophytodienoate reductase [Rhodococcus sp. SC4]
MSSLFDSYRMGNLHLPNRIVMAPMTRARATPDGMPTESLATYYAQRATAGLIVSEGVQPSLQGQSNPYTPGLHSDRQVEAWRTVTGAVHANGGRIFAQIMHAGRVGHPEVVGFTPVGPSAVAPKIELFTGPKGILPAPTPRALATDEVANEVNSYVEAARRAVQAGFDGVELHGANGYLIQQFLSSNANLRTDGYGGSINGRIRFAVEVAEATSEAIGAERVGIRLSPGGDFWDIQEDDVPELYDALLRALEPIGLTYIHTLASADEAVLKNMRAIWSNAFIVNPSVVNSDNPADRPSGEFWLNQGADLVSYGRAYLANPDLVERFRVNAALAEPDPDTIYQGGDKGYIDYPSLQH